MFNPASLKYIRKIIVTSLELLGMKLNSAALSSHLLVIVVKGEEILLSYMVIVSEAMTPTKSTSRAHSSNSESPRHCKRNFVQIHGLLVHDCPWQNVVTFDLQSHL